MKNVIFILFLIGGNILGQSNNIKNEIKSIFTKKVVVILAKEMNPKGFDIYLQDYIVDGYSILPVFTSKDEQEKSFQGTDPGKPIIEIDGILFAMLLNGIEKVIVNPSLANEKTFLGSEIKEVLSAEIEILKKELEKLK
jgi:hypothetical protein